MLELNHTLLNQRHYHNELNGVIKVMGDDHRENPAKDQIVNGQNKSIDRGIDYSSRSLIKMVKAK